MSIVWMVVGFLGSYVTGFLRMFVCTIRVNEQEISNVIRNIQEVKCFKFYLQETLCRNNQIPEFVDYLAWFGIIFRVRTEERLLQAGYNGKEVLLTLSTLRIFRKRLLGLLEEWRLPPERNDSIGVHLCTNYSFLEMNRIDGKQIEKLHPLRSKRIDDCVEEFMTGRRDRLGLLFYGPPGNGKTSLIKSLAYNKKLDIYSVILRADLNNSGIINIFSSLPHDKKILVLLEDFDSVFDKRQPIYKKCTFSLDVFLNMMDGVYMPTNNKLFCMTCNDLDKIDPALKCRPSRFDVVQYIGNPSLEVRKSLLNSYQIDDLDYFSELTKNQSVAVVCEVGKYLKFSGWELSRQEKKDKVLEIIDSFQNTDFSVETEESEKQTFRINFGELF